MTINNKINLMGTGGACTAHFLFSTAYFRSFSKNYLITASNVFTIAELANRFQIPSLLSVCERHLINCTEIETEESFTFAVLHGLNYLKVCFIVSR